MTTPKRALVTGGSGAIGHAICRTLAEAGHAVVVHANTNLKIAESLAADLRAEGHDAQAVAFDVTDADACRTALEGLLADAPPIQVLVSNAGIHDDAPMAGMTPERWQKVIDVSLNGFFNVTQPLLLPMMSTRWGRVIAISSVAGVMGNRGQANYAAAKAGLHGAVKSLALECATRGITVNAVAPGVIATPETESVFPKERIKALVPMGRAGSPDEVAAAVGFLASDAASYVSGQVLSVNGGMG